VANGLNQILNRGFLKSWWVRVLLVFGTTRLLTFSLFLLTARIQGDNYWTKAHPNYFDFLNIWDAEWYQRIYDFGLGQLPGYAVQLPIDASGNVSQNAWAFMPGFPMLVRALNLVTGIEWKFLAPLTSTALSFVLALVIYKIFVLKFSSEVALWSILLFGLSPASPVLQVGYAETLGLLLLACGLFFLMKHRYFSAVPFLVALSITRPGMVAFAMMLGGMWLVRYFKTRRGQGAFPLVERIKLAGLAALSGVLGFAWYFFAGWVTGRADAYLSTELAWRAGFTGHVKLVPIEGWFISSSWYFGQVFGPFLLIAALCSTLWVMFSPGVKALGNELRLWVGAYFVYLLLVFFPQSSTLRILLPAFPLFAALGTSTIKANRWLKMALLLVFIFCQFTWLVTCWMYTAPDTSPP
jgi:hypothetical protein